MTTYLVRAEPREERLQELRERLDSGEVGGMEPFGTEVESSLEEAKLDPETGEAVWVETCYCGEPLEAEREKLLDRYFRDFSFEEVPGDREAGERFEGLSGLWEEANT